MTFMDNSKVIFKPTRLATLIGFAVISSSTFALANEPKSQVADETIIVTGEKLGGTLQDTTSAVTIFTDEVDNGENRNYFDLLDRSANVLTAPSGMPHIRGVDGRGPADGFLSYMIGGTPRVNTTVDGVSESWTGESFGKAGLWDTEQVEIFKGPQSTNQGRNSIAGAVVIKTKDPTFYTESRLRAGYETEDGKTHLAGMISAPIVDDVLAFRLAAEGSQGNTPIEYSITNDEYPWDPSELESFNVRGKLLFKPASLDALTAKLTVASRSEEGQYTNLVTQPIDDRANRDGRTRRQNTDSWNVNLDVNYVFSDQLQADVLIARRDYDTSFISYPNPDDWFGDIEERTYTAEAKLSYNSVDDRYSVVGGLVSIDKKQESLLNDQSRLDNVQTDAIYIDSRIGLSDTFSLLVGGRYERENLERDFDHFRWPLDFVSDETNSIFLPKVGAMLQPSDVTTFSLTARKGYNAGGVGYNEYKQELFVFDQEEVWTYELGARTAVLDRKLNLAATLFFNDYENYQTLVYGESDSSLDNYVANIPDSQTYGAEFETNYYFDSGLDVFAFVGLLHTEIKQAPSNVSERRTGDLTGNDFSYAPEFSAGLGFTKYFDSGLYFGARMNHVSEYYTDLANSEEYLAGDYTVYNLSIGFEAENLSVHGYVKNVSDETYILRHKRDLVEIGDPQMVGLVVDYKF
ncbi:TonB-dependent receptor [Vibrio intestinalis]|uniref:TonB-dependent receptor n=1 Tax=Vibrio intestinalis TaxID=2933291 RepID=UPI0021A49C80|nr:TonB-dependent receptor [Vibrio intestinalis]